MNEETDRDGIQWFGPGLHGPPVELSWPRKIGLGLTVLLLLFVVVVDDFTRCRWQTGTFHDRMVSRIAEIGRDKPFAGDFIRAGLGAVEEKGYTFLRYRSDLPRIDSRTRAGFENSWYAGQVSPANRRVLIAFGSSGSWSFLGLNYFSTALDRILLHELVHVFYDDDPRYLYSGMEAEDQLRQCFDPEADPPAWLAFEHRLSEEALAHVVSEIIIGCAVVGSESPGSRELAVSRRNWQKRASYWCKERKSECFEDVFQMQFRYWERRLTAEEAEDAEGPEVLRRRYSNAHHSNGVMVNVENRLRELGLLRAGPSE